MSDTIIVSIISFIGVLLSVIISVLINSLRNKSEIYKMRKELEQQYAKSLFDKRVNVYPELYSLLSGYIKLMQYKKNNTENLITFRDSVDDWNSKYSIFFIDSTAKLSFRLRNYLKILLNIGNDSKIENEDWKLLKKIIRQFEICLKSEIGVTTIQAAGEISALDSFYKFIDNKCKQ